MSVQVFRFYGPRHGGNGAPTTTSNVSEFVSVRWIARVLSLCIIIISVAVGGSCSNGDDQRGASTPMMASSQVSTIRQLLEHFARTLATGDVDATLEVVSGSSTETVATSQL